MCNGGFMSEKSIKHLEVLAKVKERKISQEVAAKELNISVRQVYRLYQKLLEEGPSGFLSKKKGKASNHQLSKILKSRVLELVTCEKYEGFGPSFMNEKLLELHSITISTEAVRQLMIESGVWHPDKERRPIVHQQRQRRSQLGDLVQIDGSPHHWFEERGEACCLIVFIDDATGRTHGRLFETETTEAYMITLKEYILKYKGIPSHFYSDKHGIFKINTPNCVNKEQMTQFGRACKELGIGLIYANSPQAKGRVERMNRTQQDRLVKEFRLAGVSNIKQGNEFLSTYWGGFNKRFNVHPLDKKDAHLPPLSESALDRILCFKEQRTVTKNLELQYKNIIYQLIDTKQRGLCGARITVLEGLDGKISFEYKGKELKFRKFSEIVCVGEEVNSKEIDRFLKSHKSIKKLSKNHPWARGIKIKPVSNL